MSKALAEKIIDASIDFHEYMADHPELFEAIPNKSYVVFTLQDDPKFNAQSLALIRNKRRKTIVEAHKSGNRWSVRPLQSA